MRYKQTTQVPNEVFDSFLPQLSGSELKIFLIIIRQTLGWVLPNGQRKQSDRLNYAQFINKTQLSRRVIADSIASLYKKGIISITDSQNNELSFPEQRKGKTSIYYSPLFSTYAERNTKQCSKHLSIVQKPSHNKSNFVKLNEQKDWNQGVRKLTDIERQQQILSQRQGRLKF